MKYLLTKSDKKTACIKDGCKLKDFLTCYCSGNGSCTVWEEAQDRKSRKKQLEQLEKEGHIEHDRIPTWDFTEKRYIYTHDHPECWLCAALREVA